MTYHQQELDSALRITSTDRDTNRSGRLSVIQSRRARLRFALISLVLAGFFLGMLAFIVLDWESMISIAGPVVVFLSMLTGWLSVRYAQAFSSASFGSPVVSVEGMATHRKIYGTRGSCELALIVQSRQFIVEKAIWDAVREGGSYRVYFIEVGHWFPPRVVAIEEVR